MNPAGLLYKQSRQCFQVYEQSGEEYWIKCSVNIGIDLQITSGILAEVRW